MTIGKYWDKAWSLISGYTPVSEACDHCWLAGMAHRFCREGEPGHDTGILTDTNGRFNGDIFLHHDRLNTPLLPKNKKPTVFAIWSDLFHEAVPDEFINRAFVTMEGCPQHIFLLLTKRPVRILQWILNFFGGIPKKMSHHIYFGTTVENQRTTTERLPYLLEIPGKKFLSVEPLLGAITIPQEWLSQIDAVICGCESGHGARETKIEWVRSLRDQCAEAGVPFYLKQLKVNEPDGSRTWRPKLVKEPELDGVKHNQLPWRVK